jgi:uncharacterized protein YcnI
MKPLRLLAAAAAAALFLGGGTAAYAHVQVLPTVVAPLDAVKFSVIVPGESQSRTVKVELQLPPDLLPFAWEETPGWTREIVPGDDPLSLGNVVWTGDLPVDGFVEFSFLAGTPAEPGELSWKAIQTYDDGSEVRWVGPPGSEEPAAVTVVDANAPKQNAGGESSGGGEPAEPAPTETEPEATETEPEAMETEPTGTGSEEEHEEDAEAAAASDSGGSGTDWVARWLAFIGVGCAFAAIAFALLRRPRRDDQGGGEPPPPAAGA